MDELIELHEILVKHFNEEALKTLCFKLKIPYDDLPALGREGKARELVVYCHQNGRLPELVQAIKKQRPRVVLSDVLMAYLPDGKTAVSKLPPVTPTTKTKELINRELGEAVEPPKNQARDFVIKNMWKIAAVVGVVVVGITLLSLLNLIQDPENPTRETEAAATMRTGEEGGTAVAGLTPVNNPTDTLTSEVEQVEIQTPTALAESMTATANAIPILTATPSETPTPVVTPISTPQLAPTQVLDPSIPPPNPTLGSRWIRPSDNMVMVYVPAGTFPMGSDPAIDPNAQPDEQPQHEVTLDSFWIDRTEVTNEQYALCVQEGACEASSLVGDSRYNGDAQPVVGVSWFDAEDYCTWAGGQLPTEAQWEYAARGNDGYLYPWGDEFDGEIVNFCDTNCTYDWKDDDYDDGYALTAPVGSYPAGDSWVGAADMAGNVWEWVVDWYSSSYYANSPDTNPTGPDNGDYKVLRGGSWFFSAANVRSASRGNGNPTLRFDVIGFRCSAPGQ